MAAYRYRELKGFIRFIYSELKIRTKIKVKLLKVCGRLAVMHTENKEAVNTYSFGALNIEKDKVYIPLILSKADLFTSLGHEYVHVWQIENKLEVNHDEADLKAKELYDKWTKNSKGIA